MAASLRRASGLGIGEKRLRLAYERINKDSADDFLPDLIKWQDYAASLPSNFKRLLKGIAHYQPSDCLEIDVPKSPYFSRPATQLSMDDRLIYQAAMNSVAQQLDRLLEPRNVVAGYRVTSPTDHQMFGPPIGQWLKFREILRTTHTDEYEFLVNTDLVAYFEHISHDLLREKLESAGVRTATIDLIARLLRRWETSPKHGLPQGFDPSSLLANYYLDSIDKKMVREGFKYVRYMDDICIFGKTKLEIKKAMACLTSACREQRLFLNVRKTEVLEGSRIRDFLDKDQDMFLGINYFIETRQVPLARRKLKALLTVAFDRGKIDDRRYKFVLNRLRFLRDPSAVKRVLDTLEDVPQLADVSSRYLKEFSWKPATRRRVLNFLESGANLYPWQEMWLLRSLFGADKLTRPELNRIRARISNTTHWVNRSLCILLLGKYGDSGDLDFCWGLFRNDPKVDRAVVLACQRLLKNVKLQRCNEVLLRAPELRQTVALVKGANRGVWPA